MPKRFLPPDRKRYGSIGLSQRAKQIVLGGVLGDGSLKIARRYRNARYCERHTERQKAYAFWKFAALVPELGGTLKRRRSDAGSLTTNDRMHYQSRVHPGLTQLHHLTHWRNKKAIRRHWLNHLDALALTVWWCDDGSLNARTRHGVLCTDGFSYDAHKRLARYLQVDWGIFTHIVRQPSPVAHHFRLHLDRENLQRYLDIILPHMPVASLLYKVMPCYGNLKDQQRWISTVQARLPRYHDHLERLYQRPLRDLKAVAAHGGRRKHSTFVDDFLHLRQTASRALENDIVQ